MPPCAHGMPVIAAFLVSFSGPSTEGIFAMRNVGALLIGQSPRSDLVDPLIQKLPADCQVLQSGALDGLTGSDIPTASPGTYPLTTRLQDGSSIMVQERFLAPKLQQALDDLEARGAIISLLLCAGTFAGLRGSRPLIKPFAVARELLRQLGLRALGLIAPIAEQEAPIRRRWQAAGFSPSVWTSDITRQDRHFYRELQAQVTTNRLECIVLDYVGHSADDVQRLRQGSDLPVIDLGQLAITTLLSTL